MSETKKHPLQGHPVMFKKRVWKENPEWNKDNAHRTPKNTWVSEEHEGIFLDQVSYSEDGDRSDQALVLTPSDGKLHVVEWYKLTLLPWENSPYLPRRVEVENSSSSMATVGELKQRLAVLPEHWDNLPVLFDVAGSTGLAEFNLGESIRRESLRGGRFNVVIIPTQPTNARAY